MADNNNENKVVFSEASKALMVTKLDGMHTSFKCTVTGTTESMENGGLAKGVKVKGVRVRLNFNATTLSEAIEFACKGQSYRVAIQNRLRMRKVEKLEKELQEFHMSDVFHPVTTRGKVEPVTAANRAVGKLDDSQKLELMKQLEAEMAAKKAAQEKEAEAKAE